MRVDEVRIDRQRLAVLGDRLVEPAHLEEQLGVRVVRVGILRDERDVGLKRLLGVAVVAVLPVGVAEEVVRGGVARVELGGFLVVLDRLREVLLAEVVAAEVEVRPLVVRVRGDEGHEVLLLLDGVVVEARLRREDEELLAVGGLVRQGDGLVQVLEDLLAARRGVREAQLGEGERRVEGGRLLEVGDGVRDQQLLEHVAALQELGLRVGGGRRHRDLSAVGLNRGLGLGRRGGSRCLLLRAADDGDSGGDSQHPEKSERSIAAHRVLLRQVGGRGTAAFV